MPVRFIIYGQPYSKANSRELITFRYRDKVTGEMRTRPGFRKSDEALAYEAAALKQIPRLPAPILGPVRFSARIFYKSEIPDLDESLILDVLAKAGVYKNDRQVREKHIYHGIDRDNPRAVIEVEAVQADLVAEAA